MRFVGDPTAPLKVSVETDLLVSIVVYDVMI